MVGYAGSGAISLHDSQYGSDQPGRKSLARLKFAVDGRLRRADRCQAADAAKDFAEVRQVKRDRGSIR
jgi:hypothetical protein